MFKSALYLTISLSAIWFIGCSRGNYTAAPGTLGDRETIWAPRQFSIGPIGAGGSISFHQQIVDALAKYDDSRDMFIDTVERGNPVEQAYGLYGLYLMRSDEYERYKSRFLSKRDTIPVIEGCIYESRPRASIIQQIESAKR